MIVNLHLQGELAAFIDSLVKRGLAANKTEAIRQAIANYYEEQKRAAMLGSETFNQSTIDNVWNNPSDDKAEEFYRKRYLNAKKA